VLFVGSARRGVRIKGGAEQAGLGAVRGQSYELLGEWQPRSGKVCRYEDHGEKVPLFSTAGGDEEQALGDEGRWRSPPRGREARVRPEGGIPAGGQA